MGMKGLKEPTKMSAKTAEDKLELLTDEKGC